MLVVVPSVHDTPPTFQVDSCMVTVGVAPLKTGMGHTHAALGTTIWFSDAGGIEWKQVSLGMFTTPI